MALYPFEDYSEYLKYFICLLNSYTIFQYKRNFISSNSAFQINDARQIPIIIPSENHLKKFGSIFDAAIKIKKQQFSSAISEEKANEMLSSIQKELDELVEELYSV